MKKFFSLIAAVLFAGSMMAEGLLFEQTYPGSPSAFTNSYTSSFTLTTGDYTLTYANINNGQASNNWTAIRAGRKNDASTATITSEAIAAKVSKVTINFTQLNASKTKALYLQVADNASFAGAVQINATIAQGEVAFEIAEPAENKFYEIVLDMDKDGSSNGFNRWDKIQFISPDGGEPIVPTTYDTINVPEAIEIASALADNASTKEYFVEGFAVNVADYYIEAGAPKNQDFYMVADAAAPDSILLVYRATPQKDGKAYPVLEGDQLRLFGTLKKYVKDGKAQLEVVTPKVEFLNEVEGDRTIDIPVVELDTISVADALELGKNLASGKSTEKEYVIKGYSTVIKTAYDAGYKNESFWIADEKGSKAASNADGAFLVYRGKPDTEKSVGIGALVYVTTKIQKYTDGVIESIQNSAVHVAEQGGDEEVESITVAKALEIGKALANGGVSADKYEITGYVSNVYSFFNADFGNETVWITDEQSVAASMADGAFEIYRGKPNTAAEVGWGAKVKIVCQIKNYNGTTIENDGSNVPFEVLEASTFIPDTINVEEAAEIAQGLAEGAKSPKYNVVKGFIQSVVTPYDSQKNNATYKLSAFPGESEGAVQAYKATILKADAEKVAEGNYVHVTGYVMKKNAGAQIAEGAITAFVEAPETDTLHVTVAEAIEAGLSLPMGGKSDRIYAVTGFVNLVTEEFDNGIESFFMAEEAASEVYNFFAGSATLAEAAAAGQKVELVGLLQNIDGETISIENGKARIIYPEGIENIVLTEEVQKVVVDGAVYIVRGGKMFNLQGAQVR